MIPFPDKKYQIIYADPPWRYCGNMMNSSVTDHYQVMSLENICELPLQSIVSKDCVLFMWVTMPKLNEFMKVIDSWGFEYKTVAFVWVKQNMDLDGFFMGLGRWTRANPEICVLATKGSIERQAKGIRQLQMHPVSKHSKKPPIFRKLITDLVGTLPRIELFARKEDMLFDAEGFEGWDVWGNEV